MISSLQNMLDASNSMRAELEDILDGIPPESEELSAWILHAVEHLYEVSGGLERAIRHAND